jgi:hypothetical protein
MIKTIFRMTINILDSTYTIGYIAPTFKVSLIHAYWTSIRSGVMLGPLLKVTKEILGTPT